MDLPKPMTRNIVEYHNYNVRQSMPKGANQHKPTKAGRWRIKPPRRPAAVMFDLKGKCKGDMHEVIRLGLRLAKEAIEDGNKEYARMVLHKIKKIPLEYQRERLLRRSK